MLKFIENTLKIIGFFLYIVGGFALVVFAAVLAGSYIYTIESGLGIASGFLIFCLGLGLYYNILYQFGK